MGSPQDWDARKRPRPLLWQGAFARLSADTARTTYLAKALRQVPLWRPNLDRRHIHWRLLEKIRSNAWPGASFNKNTEVLKPGT